MSSSPHYKGENKPETVRMDGDKIILKPQALDITWGADSRYWRIPDKSRPGEPVELLQVSWIQVTGSIELDKLRSGQDYMLSFRLSLKPDAFGWKDSPVYLMAKPGRKGRYNWKNADLSSRIAGEEFNAPWASVLKFSVPAERVEGDKLHLGMYEIWKGKWKGGLVIHEVIIEPYTNNTNASRPFQSSSAN